MRSTTLLLALAFVLAPALAGCIAPEAPPSPQRTVNTGGEMTAKETSEDKAELCSDSISLAPPRFCATRTITVRGALTGIAKMDVDASTFNGHVRIDGGKDGEWSLVAVLQARGASADEATRRLDDIEFAWSHVEGTTHFVAASATMDGADTDGHHASLDLVLPRSVAYVVVATSSNGDVAVSGVRTEGLSATTSNGNVAVDADVTSAELRTSNGEIDAKLRPTASGRISLSTSNGGVTLAVPEDAQRGYDLEGTTSNGEVKIELRDGAKGDCPQGSQYYTPPCNHRTFRTASYDARLIRSRVTLTTSNGEIVARAA